MAVAFRKLAFPLTLRLLLSTFIAHSETAFNSSPFSPLHLLLLLFSHQCHSTNFWLFAHSNEVCLPPPLFFLFVHSVPQKGKDDIPPLSRIPTLSEYFLLDKSRRMARGKEKEILRKRSPQ